MLKNGEEQVKISCTKTECENDLHCYRPKLNEWNDPPRASVGIVEIGLWIGIGCDAETFGLCGSRKGTPT